MLYLTVIILGLVQGLCEFLPVSSSAHLILLESLLGFKSPEMTFDIVLHIGTLVAVFIFYRASIKQLIFELKYLPKALISPKFMQSLIKNRLNFKFGIFIVIGTLPTALIGYFFKDIFHYLFSSIFLVGCALLVTGVVLSISGKLNKKEARDIGEMTIKDALIIGLIQGLAITPGFSRSGFTISAALFLGLKRELAVRFSFILSIPAILGALCLEAFKGFSGSFAFDKLALGFFISFIAGYWALSFLVKIIKNNSFSKFSYWCWAAGLFAITYSFFL